MPRRCFRKPVRAHRESSTQWGRRTRTFRRFLFWKTLTLYSINVKQTVIIKKVAKNVSKKAPLLPLCCHFYSRHVLNVIRGLLERARTRLVGAQKNNNSSSSSSDEIPRGRHRDQLGSEPGSPVHTRYTARSISLLPKIQLLTRVFVT